MTDVAPTLSAARQLWVAEALLDGHDADAVIARLVGAGTPEALARDAVAAVAASPAFLVARRRLRPHRLRQRTTRTGTGGIDVRPGLDAATFRDTHVAHGVPVLVPGFCADWPAASWTPEALADRLGDVPIQVCVGREAADEPDRGFRALTTTMTLRAYVARLRATSPTNDLYTVANHRNLDGPLRPLLDDVTPPDGFADRDRLHRNTSLWLGPAGTRTVLHHDTSSVLFCQLHGRKRVRLVPPVADRLADGATDFYAGVDLDDPDVHGPDGPLDGIPVTDVVVGPGDMLLLPVGWWHQVEALDDSISVSIVALPWANRFDDHVAGAP